MACRKLVCPKSMYLFESSCVPTFECIQHMAFNTTIEIVPQKEIKKDTWQYYQGSLSHELRRNVIKYNFEHKMKYYFDLWVKSNSNYVVANIVNLQMVPDTVDECVPSLQILDRISRFLKSLNTKIRYNNEDVDIDASIVSVALFQQKGNETKPLKKDQSFDPVIIEMVKKSTAPPSNTQFYELISSHHFCHRVVVTPLELVSHNEVLGTVKRTNRLVELDRDEHENLLVCIDDIITTDVQTSVGGNQESDESRVMWVLKMVSGSAAALFIIFVIFVRLISSYRHSAGIGFCSHEITSDVD